METFSIEKPENDNQKRVYLIYDKLDEDKVSKISEYINNKGIKVVTSIAQENKVELIDKHRTNLVLSDGVLIFHKSGHEQWVKSKLKDLIKTPGFGRTTPITSQVLYLPDSKLTIDKKLVSNQLVIAENAGEFNESVLASFVEKINN